ncbi:MAG: nucleotide triphosphate diphosphatase NUDT15 [Candidatus Saccharimonadales bacterium]
MSNIERPKVGIGLLVVKGNSILLGERKSSHGQGEFGGPGGHLELFESFEDCIMREFKEEVGDKMQIKNLGYLCTTNLMKYPPKHYVDIGMIAEWESGEPIVCEPDKLTSWEWYEIDKKLPGVAFGCLENYLEAFKTGRTYFKST